MQTIAQTEKKVYTPEEYLEFEVNSEERNVLRIPVPSGRGVSSYIVHPGQSNSK